MAQVPGSTDERKEKSRERASSIFDWVKQFFQGIMFDMQIHKLRILSRLGGLFLVGLGIWAFLRYDLSGSSGGIFWTVLLGFTVVALPVGIAYAKFKIGRMVEQVRVWRDPDHRSSIYITELPVENPDRTLDSIAAELTNQDGYDEIQREEFSDGPGLTIVYSMYHNMFIRVLDSGRIIVSGDSVRLEELADIVDAVTSPSLERPRVDPLAGPEPTRGAPRAALAVCLVCLILVGTVSVSGAAYPSSAYNSAEKTILVSLDLRSDLDPTVTDTQTRLAKAKFLVYALEEKSVELLLANTTDRRIHHGRHMLTISSHANQLLKTARRSAGPEYSQRITRIENDLDEAEREAAEATSKAIERSDNEKDELATIQQDLQRRSNTLATTTASNRSQVT